MGELSGKLQLHTWGTPNGRKVSIALEEMGLEYDVYPINILKDEQFSESFIKISPNSKIPALIDPTGVDGEPFSVFESGAILIYLAEKTGQFYPEDTPTRSLTLQWLMWQMAGFGPILGQLHHFRKFAKVEVPYAIERFDSATDRAYRTLDMQLSELEFVAGNYSIADMAIFPWAARFEWQNIDLATYPNVKRWFDVIANRPAVKKGMCVPFLN